jgi:hypothetical protein
MELAIGMRMRMRMRMRRRKRSRRTEDGGRRREEPVFASSNKLLRYSTR